MTLKPVLKWLGHLSQVVIGDKEEEIDSVALRALDGTNLGIFNLPNLYKLMDELIEKKGRTE